MSFIARKRLIHRLTWGTDSVAKWPLTSRLLWERKVETLTEGTKHLIGWVLKGWNLNFGSKAELHKTRFLHCLFSFLTSFFFSDSITPFLLDEKTCQFCWVQSVQKLQIRPLQSSVANSFSIITVFHICRHWRTVWVTPKEFDIELHKALAWILWLIIPL